MHGLGSGVRKCAQCGALDRVHGETPEGEPEHWVKPELRYLKSQSEFTPRLAGLGWKWRMFNGRPAIERLSCIDCLNQNALRDWVWSELKESARRLEQTEDKAALGGFYVDLCES